MTMTAEERAKALGREMRKTDAAWCIDGGPNCFESGPDCSCRAVIAAAIRAAEVQAHNAACGAVQAQGEKLLTEDREAQRGANTISEVLEHTNWRSGVGVMVGIADALKLPEEKA